MKGPIGAVKSNDLSDEEIRDLWISFDPEPENERLSFYDPAAPMATVVLGGKGSGKTHMLRFYSFPVQGLRYAKAGERWDTSIARDGFIGVYTRAGGLNGSRFCGKGVEDWIWRDVFSYYLELWFGIEFLGVIGTISLHVNELRREEKRLVEGFCSCFDVPPVLEQLTIPGLIGSMKEARRALDVCINDLVFGGSLEFSIRSSPGRIVFGFPQTIKSTLEIFSSTQFSYCVDEYENFLKYQQECVNTLIREREPPVTFRIGARSYGFKSRNTNSAGEEIRAGSEYNELRLDDRLRGDPKKFSAFARQMVVQRTGGYGGPASVTELEKCFATHHLKEANVIGNHLTKLKQQLKGVLPAAAVSEIIQLFQKEQSLVVQKAAVYSLYREAAKKERDLLFHARKIANLMPSAESSTDNTLNRIIKHYKSDFEAQLRTGVKAGAEFRSLDDYELMAEGLPRVFLTIIKNIFGWANFEMGAARNHATSSISLDARRRGVEEASRWFFRDVPQSGAEGEKLVTSIERLATLFRLNRYSDKPMECSLIQFSMPINLISPASKERILHAENRCLLIRRPAGEKDRNSAELRRKYQLNRVLCPMFGLPVGRRGTARFNEQTIEAIFGDADEDHFKRVQEDLSQRLNWPFSQSGRGRVRKSRSSDQQGEMF